MKSLIDKYFTIFFLLLSFFLVTRELKGIEPTYLDISDMIKDISDIVDHFENNEEKKQFINYFKKYNSLPFFSNQTINTVIPYLEDLDKKRKPTIFYFAAQWYDYSKETDKTKAKGANFKAICDKITRQIKADLDKKLAGKNVNLYIVLKVYVKEREPRDTVEKPWQHEIYRDILIGNYDKGDFFCTSEINKKLYGFYKNLNLPGNEKYRFSRNPDSALVHRVKILYEVLKNCKMDTSKMEGYYGDVVNEPEIAPTQSGGNKSSGLFGCLRTSKSKDSQTLTCGNIKNSDGLYLKQHDGLDIETSPNTPLHSVLDGIVHSIKGTVSDKKGAGLRVYITCKTKDSVTVHYGYCHLSKVNIKVKDKVKKGQLIAEAGTSGNAWNVDVPHCHLVVYDLNFVNFLNPANYINSKFGTNGERIKK